MAGRTFDNGRLTDVTIEIEAGPSGDIQVITEKQLVSISTALADSEFTVGAAAVKLTDKNLPATATRALISVEGNAIRWWDDGKTPTATQGHLLKPPSGDAVYFWILGRNRLTDWSMIRESADATVRVAYYE